MFLQILCWAEIIEYLFSSVASEILSMIDPIDNEEEKKSKTKKVEKTTWDWELYNSAKPIWTRKPDDNE